MLQEVVKNSILPASQMCASTLFTGMPHSFSVLLLLLQILGTKSQELVQLETKDPLTMAAGETLTLHCMSLGFSSAKGHRIVTQKSYEGKTPHINSEKWFPSQEPASIVRSDPDYSIRISKVMPEDPWAYNCMKEHELQLPDQRPLFSMPSITGPPSRVDPGTSVTFNCSAEVFFPQDTLLTWLKDKKVIPASRTDRSSYDIMSSVEVFLTEKDVKSELVCQLEHESPDPLRQSFKLGDALRVAPKMMVEPSQVLEATADQLVTITCSAKGFYPNDTSLVWRKKSSEVDLAVTETVTQDQDGTFSVRSSLEVNTSEQRNDTIFSCLAMRSSRTLVHIDVVLKINSDLRVTKEGQWLSSNPGLWVAFALNKIVAVLFLSFLFLRKMLDKTNQTHTPVATYEMVSWETHDKQ